MGGNISRENTRVNIIIPKKLKRKAESYAKISNRSTSNACLRILTNPVVAEKFHDHIDDPAMLRFDPFMSELEEMKEEGQERMNLVVPIQVKEQLQAEAEKRLRSLNNYIVSFLYYYFMAYWDQGIAEDAVSILAKHARFVD